MTDRVEFEEQPTLYIDGVPPNHVITVDGKQYKGEDCNVDVSVRLWVVVTDGPPQGTYKNVSLGSDFHRYMVDELLS